MASKRGGARPGAGRKKTAVKNETALELARRKVVDKLPEIVDAMIAAATTGDVKAGIYLMDRALGKVAQAVEHSGPEGGAMAVSVVLEAAAAKLYGAAPTHDPD